MKTPKLAIDVRQLAKNTRVTRIENGLTVKHMAARVGLTPATIKRIEKAITIEGAKNYVPSYRTLFKLANATRVTVHEFTNMQLNFK
jgi:transcriptional regulator with XRE-family HTH domain